jgi:ribosomal protein S18 acetylase RimI-like enzyme
MTIRTANLTDIAAINRLAVAIWHQHYPSIISTDQINYMLSKMYDPETLLQNMNNGHVFLVAEENDSLLGYLGYHLPQSGQAFLDKLYVDTHYHGKNIGGLLLQKMIETISPNTTIRLQVNRKNYKAINFYFKHGFTIEQVADFDIGNGYFMNDFVMIRK